MKIIEYLNDGSANYGNGVIGPSFVDQEVRGGNLLRLALPSTSEHFYAPFASCCFIKL